MMKPSRQGSAPPGAHGQASSQAKPEDRLTPEESRRRKFDILDGIDAIPVMKMPSSLKPLVRQMLSYARYGRRLCYASSKSLAKKTGCSDRMVRYLIPSILESGWFLAAGRRKGLSGRSRPQFAVGPRLIKYIRYWLAYVDKQQERRRGETCGTTCSTSCGTTCSTSSEPRVPLHPYSSSGPNNRDDDPVPGRDVRTSGMGPAPSVPANSDGGTIPLSPPSASTLAEERPEADNDVEDRSTINVMIDYHLTRGEKLTEIQIKLKSYLGETEHGQQLIDEEIAKRSAIA